MWCFQIEVSMNTPSAEQVAKKPTKKDTVPKKGAMVKGQSLQLKSFGTISQNPSQWQLSSKTFGLLDDAGCFSATTCANTRYFSVRGSRDYSWLCKKPFLCIPYHIFMSIPHLVCFILEILAFAGLCNAGAFLGGVQGANGYPPLALWKVCESKAGRTHVWSAPQSLTFLVFFVSHIACAKAFLRAGLTQPLEHAKSLLLAISRGWWMATGRSVEHCRTFLHPKQCLKVCINSNVFQNICCCRLANSKSSACSAGSWGSIWVWVGLALGARSTS